jgi:hypothetical protein
VIFGSDSTEQNSDFTEKNSEFYGTEEGTPGWGEKNDEIEKLGLFEVVATREEHGHLHGHPLDTTANS